MARKPLKVVPDQPGRAVTYIRVSALMGRGGDDFHSPDIQKDGIRRAIGLAGLREVAVIDDDIDQSGRSLTRPGIERIKRLVESRQVDVVAVYNLSRVGRNLAESLTFIQWLRDRNVSVISSQENIDDSPEGQYMVGQWLGMAQLRSDQIAREWARVIERRARRGKAHGHAGQGYIKVDGRLQKDPKLASAVTEMFGAYSRGDTVANITDAFSEARGKPIARSRIKVMLRNPLYRGRIVVESKTAGRLDLPGEHPPLVDEDTWEKVQQRMAADRIAPPRHLAPMFSVTGLLICAGCEFTLQVWCSTENGTGELRTPRVICQRKREKLDCPGIGTPLVSRIETVLLDHIERYASELKGNPGERAARLTRAARSGADVATLERELREAQQAMIRLTERWARGGVPDAAYEETITQLLAEEKTKTKQLGLAREAATPPDPGETVALIERLLDMWPKLTGTERNQGLKAVLRSAMVRKANRWREPESERVFKVRFRW